MDWGLKHRDLSGITAIGVDEIQYRNGHQYLTLVYQINNGCRRLLWIGKRRTKEAFSGFFDMLGEKACEGIQFVCSDMWRAYLDVIAKRLPDALHILDRFHIVANLNKAVDETRRREVANLRQRGEPAFLKKARWILLKRKANLSRSGKARLRDLLAMNLTTIKAYLFKEEFDHLWSYTSPTWAQRFLDQWCTDVMRHRSLPDLKKFAQSMRRHRGLIINYFHARKQFSSGIIEGFNNKAKLCIRKSFGFRSDRLREVALFHALGNLPEPKATHRIS